MPQPEDGGTVVFPTPVPGCMLARVDQPADMPPNTTRLGLFVEGRLIAKVFVADRERETALALLDGELRFGYSGAVMDGNTFAGEFVALVDTDRAAGLPVPDMATWEGRESAEPNDDEVLVGGSMAIIRLGTETIPRDDWKSGGQFPEEHILRIRAWLGGKCVP